MNRLQAEIGIINFKWDLCFYQLVTSYDHMSDWSWKSKLFKKIIISVALSKGIIITFRSLKPTLLKICSVFFLEQVDIK